MFTIILGVIMAGLLFMVGNEMDKKGAFNSQKKLFKKYFSKKK